MSDFYTHSQWLLITDDEKMLDEIKVPVHKKRVFFNNPFLQSVAEEIAELRRREEPTQVLRSEATPPVNVMREGEAPAETRLVAEETGGKRDEQIRKALQDGLSGKEAATALGISTSAYSRELKRLGLGGHRKRRMRQAYAKK